MDTVTNDQAYYELFETAAQSLEALYELAMDDRLPRARVLFYALAAYLDENGILEDMSNASTFMLAHSVCDTGTARPD